MAGHPHTHPAAHSFRHLRRNSPDSDHDASHISPVPFSVHPGSDFDMTPATGHYISERVRLQSRRTSTLSYQNSGAQDFRDRSHSRTHRNLVVVFPPPDFPVQHGQLGNVLSTGPRHRLSQGILMPLFPSMFGQLHAIAREYNFPSTVGLCLYLHVSGGGVTMTPRISDESWQHLFGHLFEGRLPSSSQQLPIGGSIEFDVDLDKARWFDAWVSGILRDADPFPSVVTSQAPLAAHLRRESQTVNADEHPADDRWDASGSHTLVTNSRPATLCHLPKRLSLVDRLESYGLHAPPRLQDRSGRPDSPGSPQTHQTNALSPPPQSAIPHVAKGDLEQRVSSWRATTELYPVSMTETYQPVPDRGLSMGAAVDAYALEQNFRQAVNIDESLLSVTSAKPSSPMMDSPITSSQPISVQLDRPANGTIPLSPITATSWGPTDDEWGSIVSSVSRLPSPDVGERIVEDIMVPRSHAVWGNSFGWCSAMTWKEVYPYSSPRTKPAVSVQPSKTSSLVPQYPNLVIYPTVGPYSDTHSSPDIFIHHTTSTRSVWGSSFGWWGAVTWKKVYPYSIVTVELVALTQPHGTGGLVSVYPKFCIYPEIYPYLEIYPACAANEDTTQPVSVVSKESNKLAMCYPTLVIYPAVYPHFDVYPGVVGDVKIMASDPPNTGIYSLNGAPTSYPNLVIYPAVYPHFDLYPKTLQVDEILKQMEVDVKLVNSYLAAEYPNMTVYPDAYPYLDVYPAQDSRMRAPSISWGMSFGLLTAKAHLPEYPLKTAASADIVVGKQEIWGSSFGWKNAPTWRAVWPTAYARIRSVYPHLTIYPAAYPHFNIYPPRSIAGIEGSLATNNNQCIINPISRYPNLVVYPEIYPRTDVYPPIATDLVSATRGRGQSNLRHRRIETWRAQMTGHVGLDGLLTINHIRETEEPLQIDSADYAWSRTSAGPSMSPVELCLASSRSGSVNIDHRIQQSMIFSPFTATTWGPRDDDRYSEIISIKRLPSPDLGQRAIEDVENTDFYRPWRLVWPFFGYTNQAKNHPSVLKKPSLVPEYPNLVIYPSVYSHFELYPPRTDIPASEDQEAETRANLNYYPVFDIYPAVYPHFNIYPAIDLRAEVPGRTSTNVWHERVKVRPPSVYPDFDIHHACYPYNLDHTYPFINVIESTPTTIKGSRGYPRLVIYPPVYPFIIPYPGFLTEISQSLKQQQPPSILSPPGWKSVSVKLPVRYPTSDIYSAVYPWSLESIYPPVSADGYSRVVKPHSSVYPFVQPYSGVSGSAHIPGILDGDECKSTNVVSLRSPSESKHINPESVVYPHFDLYPVPPSLPSQQERAIEDADSDNLVTPPSQRLTITQGHRKTHGELRAMVLRCSEEQLARNSKPHSQLHNDVFQDGAVWTPSGYVQDLVSLTMREPEDIVPVWESQHQSPQDNPISRRPRSGSRIHAVQSLDKVVSALAQPPALYQISPLRARSPESPSQLSPAASEAPMPRARPQTNAFTQSATVSRSSQAVKSMMPSAQRRHPSATPVSPLAEEHMVYFEDQHPPMGLSSSDRRTHTGTSETLTHTPQSSHRRENSVLQRARAYEPAAGERLK